MKFTHTLLLSIGLLGFTHLFSQSKHAILDPKDSTLLLAMEEHVDLKIQEVLDKMNSQSSTESISIKTLRKQMKDTTAARNNQAETFNQKIEDLNKKIGDKDVEIQNCSANYKKLQQDFDAKKGEVTALQNNLTPFETSVLAFVKCYISNASLSSNDCITSVETMLNACRASADKNKLNDQLKAIKTILNHLRAIKEKFNQSGNISFKIEYDSIQQRITQIKTVTSGAALKTLDLKNIKIEVSAIESLMSSLDSGFDGINEFAKSSLSQNPSAEGYKKLLENKFKNTEPLFSPYTTWYKAYLTAVATGFKNHLPINLK